MTTDTPRDDAKHTPEPWTPSAAHARVLNGIADGLGAWNAASLPKQRGYRSGLLSDLKQHGLIDWKAEGALHRYFLTDAGRAATGRNQ